MGIQENQMHAQSQDCFLFKAYSKRTWELH
jgi:hypothetical protein